MLGFISRNLLTHWTLKDDLEHLVEDSWGTFCLAFGSLRCGGSSQTDERSADERSAAKCREEAMEGGRIEEEEKSTTVPVTGLINGHLGGSVWPAG